jgi:hypothetical protein
MYDEKSILNILFAYSNNLSVVDLINFVWYPSVIFTFSFTVIFINIEADLVTIDASCPATNDNYYEMKLISIETAVCID